MLHVYPKKQMFGSAGLTSGRITSTGLFNKFGYQIVKYGTCDIRLKYEGRRVRVMEMGLLSRGRLRLAIKSEIAIKEAIKIVIGDQVCDRN